MPVVTADYLKALQLELRHYVAPDNREGFFRTFLIWVVKTWQKANYYDTEVRDLGYDCSRFPVATNDKLCERITFYREFINANTGVSVYTFEPGMGMCCESYETKLQELYGDACSRQIAKFVSQHKLTLPATMAGADTEDVVEAIFMEAFDPGKTPELARISDDILLEFNQLGWAQAPYTCPRSSPTDYDDNHFGGWTLQDFKKAMLV